MSPPIAVGMNDAPHENFSRRVKSAPVKRGMVPKWPREIVEENAGTPLAQCRHNRHGTVTLMA